MILPRETVVSEESGPPVTLWFAALVERFGNGIIVGVALVAVITGIGISQLKVENRFIDYFHKDTEIYQGMELIDQELGGTIPFDIVIKAEQLQDTLVDVVEESLDEEPFEDDFFDDGFEDDGFSDDGFGDSFGEENSAGKWFTRSGLSQVETVHDYLEAQPQLGKVLSLATIFKVTKDLAGNDVDDIQLAIAKRSMPEIVEEVLIAPYYDQENEEVRISVRAKETSRDLNRNELLKKVRHDLVHELGFEEDQVRVGGLLVLYNNMLQSLYSSQIQTLGAVFVAIMIMFFVLFRSVVLAVIAIFPNLLAAGAVLGGMGLAGIPLDMMTITIAAICIGIGVDDTVHYIYRFKEEFKQDQNYHGAMFRSHASIGKAMYYTSVIIVVGFGVLALSNFKPTIYFGLLTGAGMVAALLGALLILPRLIVLFKPFGPEKSA